MHYQWEYVKHPKGIFIDLQSNKEATHKRRGDAQSCGDLASPP